MKLYDFGFLFLIGGVLAIAALRTLHAVKEEGEVERNLAVAEMKIVFRKKIKEKMSKENIIQVLLSPINYPIALKRRIERKVIVMRKWNQRSPERKTA